MKNYSTILIFLLISFFGIGQNVKHIAQFSTGYNRIGFYNELAYKIDAYQHQLKIGGRHYTFDNFFEKNTIGISLDYTYQIQSRGKHFYFYPGVSYTFFKEHKTNVVVNLTDIKLISGVGFKIYKGLSIYYQLGFGVLDAKSELKKKNETVKANYFNYEMAFGLSYRFGSDSK